MRTFTVLVPLLTAWVSLPVRATRPGAPDACAAGLEGGSYARLLEIAAADLGLRRREVLARLAPDARAEVEAERESTASPATAWEAVTFAARLELRLARAETHADWRARLKKILGSRAEELGLRARAARAEHRFARALLARMSPAEVYDAILSARGVGEAHRKLLAEILAHARVSDRVAHVAIDEDLAARIEQTLDGSTLALAALTRELNSKELVGFLRVATSSEGRYVTSRLRARRSEPRPD